jgi:hypothetical protein
MTTKGITSFLEAGDGSESGKGYGHHREAEDLNCLASSAVHQEHGQCVAWSREQRKDGQLSERLLQQRMIAIERGEHHGARDRVAVVRSVHEKPGSAHPD